MTTNIPGSVTKSEIAQAYGISLRSFSSWLKTAGISFKGSHYLTPKIVEKIIDEFGIPKKWE
jgi:hypothetical protein